MQNQSGAVSPSYLVVERLPVAGPSSGAGAGVETTVVWQILWQHMRLILLVGLLSAFAALLYSVLTPSLYSATSQVIIDPRDRVIIANDITPSSMSPDGGVTQVESQVSVMQSNGVLLRAIAATDSIKDTEFNGQGLLDRVLGLFDGLFGGSDTVDSGAGKSGGSEGAISDIEAKTLANLRRRLAVKRADKVLVIDVTVTARGAIKASRLANAIADAYLEEQSVARSAAARQASQSIRARLAEQRKRVEDAETAAEKFRAANNLVTSTGQLVSDQQLNELGNQLSAARARTATLKAQVDQQRQGGVADSTAEAQRSAVVVKLREQEAALVESLANLGTQLGDRHPSLISSQARLTNVRALIASELQRVGKSSLGEYERAVSNEKALAARFEQAKTLSLSNDSASIRLRELQREVEAVRSVYANFLVRAQETSEQANINTTNARIITRAIKPQKRSWPPTGLLVFGAALSGLAVAASGVLVREFMKPVVRSPAQIAALASAPVVATIRGVGGLSDAGNTKADGHSSGRWFGTRSGRAGEAGSGLHRATASVVAAVDPASLRAVQVLLADRKGEAPGRSDASAKRSYDGRSIAITSAASDLAERMHVVRLVAATSGHNGDETLLVDADLSDDKQSPMPGLMDYLRGDCSMSDAVHWAEDGDYMLMEAGTRRTRFRTVSQRDFDRQAFAVLRQQTDLMVVDVGALGDNHLATPFVTGANEVLFVALEGQTSHAEVTAAADVARLIGAPITGVVLVRA